MTDRLGNVADALAWLDPWIGVIAYDHDAAAATRFGPAVYGQKFPSHSAAKIADCSGMVMRGAIEAGMPRWYQGIPESSGSTNAWADRHPDLLVYSIHGGGRYGSLSEALRLCARGTVFGIGDYQNLDAGHTGYIADEPNGTPIRQTLESASSLGGIRHGSTGRFSDKHAITHLYELPMHYTTTEISDGEMTMDQECAAAFAKVDAKLDTLLAFDAELKATTPDPKRPWVASLTLLRTNVVGFIDEMKGPRTAQPWSDWFGRTK